MANKRYDQFPAGTYDTAKIFLQADAVTGTLEKINLPTINTILPSQVGNSGKFLTTNGTIASWAAVPAWSLTGNSGTTAGTNYIGTNDAIDLVFKTNAAENMRIKQSTGYVGINSNNPLARFEVIGSANERMYINNTSSKFFEFFPGTAFSTIVFDSSASFAISKSATRNNNSPSPVLTISPAGLLTAGTIEAGGDGSGNSYTRATQSTNFIEASALGASYGGLTFFSSGFFSISTAAAKGNNNPTQLLRLTAAGAMGLGLGNANPAAAALLELKSTAKGFLPTRMTTTQKNAIASPGEGLFIYDTTLHKLCVFTGSVWETVTST